MTQTLKIVVIIAALISLTACGIIKPQPDDIHYDPVLLREAVNEYFTAKLNGDTNKMYDYINPSSRDKISREGFIKQQKQWANMKIDAFDVGEIKFTEKDIASVEVGMLVDAKPFKTQFPFIYEEGRWYRYYPLYGADKK